MCHDTNNSERGDRVWGVSVAVIFGVFFIFFVVGLVFGPRDPDATTGALIATMGFTLWLGCMTIGGIGIAASKPWGDRFTNRLLSLAVLAIQVVFVRGLIIDIAAHDAPPAACYYAVAVWIGVGLVMYFGSWAKATKPGYLECALWPVFLFLKAPVASVVLFAIPAASVVAGEWIGGEFQHPHIGAAVGFGFFLTAVVFATYGSKSLTCINKRSGNDD